MLASCKFALSPVLTVSTRLYGGRALAHEHIPVMTTFASFFIAFHICRAIFGVGLLTSTTCLLAAYGGHW